MYIAVLHYKGILRPGDKFDVVEINSAIASISYTLSPSTAQVRYRLLDGTASWSSAANSGTITVSSANRAAYEFELQSNAANSTVTIRALNASGDVLQEEVLRVYDSAMRYKSVGNLLSFTSNIALYNAKKSQIQKLRGKSYIWNVGMVPDVPTSAADEVYIGLPITQPFDVSFNFEEIAYGQGSGMRSTGEIRIPLAMLEPTLLKAIAAKSNELMDAIEQGRPNRGFAMVEFFNEKYSIVLNNVPVNATFEANANGADPNNENNMGVITIDVSGKSVTEILAGFNEIS